MKFNNFSYVFYEKSWQKEKALHPDWAWIKLGNWITANFVVLTLEQHSQKGRQGYTIYNPRVQRKHSVFKAHTLLLIIPPSKQSWYTHHYSLKFLSITSYRGNNWGTETSTSSCLNYVATFFTTVNDILLIVRLSMRGDVTVRNQSFMVPRDG
jgi:hypothetical protein